VSAAATRAPLVGVSAICVGAEDPLSAAREFGAQAVELCAVGTEVWGRLAPAVRASGMAVGLHAPLPFDGRLEAFEITGPTDAGLAEALGLVEATLEAAAGCGARYVVVHFPTPRPRGFVRAPCSAPATRVREAGEALTAMARRFGVAVLVENVSFNPDWGSARDYRSFFTAFPELRLCLDVGHAHLSPHVRDVAAFAAELAPWTAAAHLYNTRRDGGAHLVPTPDQEPAAGFADLRAVLRLLLDAGTLEYAVLEYHVERGDDPLEAFARTAWLRQALGGDP
jgi:sugar phosphate isomerase/epimerase